MNINSVSGVNPYLKLENPETVAPVNSPVKEPVSDLSKNVLNQENGTLSSQAFQVTITDQAREILRTEQASQEPRQPQEMTQTNNNTLGQNQGPQKIVDLIA